MIVNAIDGASFSGHTSVIQHEVKCNNGELIGFIDQYQMPLALDPLDSSPRFSLYIRIGSEERTRFVFFGHYTFMDAALAVCEEMIGLV